MQLRFLSLLSVGLTLALTVAAQDANPTPPQVPWQAGDSRTGQRGGGGGGMMGGFRGVMGTVTEVGTDHYAIKNEGGEIYTVHFSVNTRMMKQPAQRQGQGAERTPPAPIKASDIKVGDAIAANGDVDPAAKSVGAVFVVQLDPERAKQMREMQANFGKTWLVGKVTAINEVTVTLQSPIDNAVHTFVADENTSFRKRREPITLADMHVADNVRVEGAVKDGVFVATTVSVMGLQATGGPAPRPGPPPQ